MQMRHINGSMFRGSVLVFLVVECRNYAVIIRPGWSNLEQRDRYQINATRTADTCCILKQNITFASLRCSDDDDDDIGVLGRTD